MRTRPMFLIISVIKPNKLLQRLVNFCSNVQPPPPPQGNGGGGEFDNLEEDDDFGDYWEESGEFGGGCASEVLFLHTYTNCSNILCSPMGHRGFLHAHDRRTDHRWHRGLLHEQEAEPPYKPNDRAATEVVTPHERRRCPT